MDQVIRVELRDADGVTTARLRVPGSPITLGRGGDNTVVVDDEFVDTEHLRVTIHEDGRGVLVRDVGSTNGTLVNGTVMRGGEVEVPLGKPVVMGRTTVVFASSDTPLRETRVLPGRHDRLFPYERLPVWTPALLLVGLLTLYGYGTSYDAMGVPEAIGLGVGVAILLLIWVGMWAVGSRLFAGAAHFREHLALASVLGLVMVPLTSVVGWMTFAVGHPFFESVVDWGVMGVGAWGLVLFGHLDVASRKRRRTKALLAGALSAGIVTMAALFGGLEVTPAQQIARSLTAIPPVPAGLTRSTSLEAFLDKVEGMAAELDREAEKSLATRRQEDGTVAPPLSPD